MKITLFRFWTRFLCALPIMLFVGQADCSNVYAYVDKQGKLFVSEKKTDERFVRFEPKKRVTPKVTVRKTAWVTKRIGSPFAQTTQNEQIKGQITANIPIHNKAVHYTPLINGIADEVGVNANLLHAIIQVESAYNPEATSPKGAQGLMQLIPATAERFGVEKSYDPAANVRGGAKYIKNLLTRFDNNLQLALAAYNAGEGTVQRYNNTIPPYPETQAYVVKVLSLFTQREE
jgi:SLT domain-containing protein